MSDLLRVLVLEDRREDAELTVYQLQRAGFTLDWTLVDTRAAFADALALAPDIVLSDFNLPGFSGLDALRLMHERGLDLPFIVITGAFAAGAVACMREGASDYLLKDDLQRLGTAVTNALDLHRLRRATQQAEAALRASELHFRGLFENAAIGLFRTDSEGRLFLANTALALMLGYASPDELVGQLLPLSNGAAEQNDARAAGMRARARSGDQLRWRRSNGTEITVHLRVWPVSTDDGAVQFYEGSADDITEQRAMSERLVRAERLYALGEMAAGTAHEINNPLAVVAGLAELLLHGDLSPTQRDDVVQIQQEASRAGEIVRTLLRFSRQRDPSLQPLDPTTVLDEALRLRQHRLQQYRITVERRVTPVPEVLADCDQLLQVLLNLINNAIDAMAAAGSGSLSIALQPRGDGIELRIADSGEGIPETVLARIFDPFFTTKPVGQGTGLGLSISHEIVSQHRGELIAENRPEGGACFRLLLPAVAAAAEQTVQDCAQAQQQTSRPRVLILHPDPATAAALAEAVRLSGHDPLVTPPQSEQPGVVVAVLAHPELAETHGAVFALRAAGARLIALGTPAINDGCWDAVLPPLPRLSDLADALQPTQALFADEGPVS